MGRGYSSDTWVAYGLLAVAVLLVTFGCWRLYVSQFGTPEQFLGFKEAGAVEGVDKAIIELERLVARVDPQGREKREAEESLKQLRELRDRLARDRDARTPAARRTEQLTGSIGLVAGVALFGIGLRRLPHRWRAVATAEDA